jgi:hypothetical protein
MKGAPGMLVALGLKPKKGAESDDDDAPDMGSETKRDAARSLIAAVKSGDVDGVMDALERAYDACAHGESESEEEE